MKNKMVASLKKAWSKAAQRFNEWRLSEQRGQERRAAVMAYKPRDEAGAIAQEMVIYLGYEPSYLILGLANARIVDLELNERDEGILRQRIAAFLQEWGYGEEHEKLLEITAMPKTRSSVNQFADGLLHASGAE
jgi:hypothetical protein